MLNPSLLFILRCLFTEHASVFLIYLVALLF